MTRTTARAWMLSLPLAGLIVAVGFAQTIDSNQPHDTVPEADAIERFLTSGAPVLQSYRARRTLEASTRGGRMTAALEAWTSLDSNGAFRYDVVESRGSEMILKRVLIAALDEERRIHERREGAASELTPANYDFRMDTAGSTDLLAISLIPHRRSTRLVNGTVFTLRDDGDLVRMEGRLSKRPSFWTKSVDIVRRYARIGGVRVPVEMRSRADVRIVGESTFAMTYDYAVINGAAVAPQAPVQASLPAR